METEEFTPCVTDYDLTIKLTTGYTETISYRSKLKISPKTNISWNNIFCLRHRESRKNNSI